MPIIAPIVPYVISPAADVACSGCEQPTRPVWLSYFASDGEEFNVPGWFCTNCEVGLYPCPTCDRVAALSFLHNWCLACAAIEPQRFDELIRERYTPVVWRGQAGQPDRLGFQASGITARGGLVDSCSKCGARVDPYPEAARKISAPSGTSDGFVCEGDGTQRHVFAVHPASRAPTWIGSLVGPGFIEADRIRE